MDNNTSPLPQISKTLVWTGILSEGRDLLFLCLIDALPKLTSTSSLGEAPRVRSASSCFLISPNCCVVCDAHNSWKCIQQFPCRSYYGNQAFNSSGVRHIANSLPRLASRGFVGDAFHTAIYPSRFCDHTARENTFAIVTKLNLNVKLLYLCFRHSLEQL